MSLLSQFFGGSKKEDLGTYGVGLAAAFTNQIPVDIMLIGGGGGGGSVKNTPFNTVTNVSQLQGDSQQGGGGGTGRVLVYTNCIVDLNKAYPITVGAGGAADQRGGTSTFGVLKAGGGGRGAGFNPDGTPQTTSDIAAPLAGRGGGYSNGPEGWAPISGPSAAFYPSGYLVPQYSQLLTNGNSGSDQYSDNTLSISGSASNYVTNATNVFKQAVNSINFNSPSLSSPGRFGDYNYDGAFPGLGQPQSGGFIGVSAQAGVGANTPDFRRTDPSIIKDALFSDLRRYQYPSITSPAPFFQNDGNTDFIRDFFDRAQIPSPLQDGVGGYGAGGIRQRSQPGAPFSFSPGSAPPFLSGFESIAPYEYTGNSNFPSSPASQIARTFRYANTGTVSSPAWNRFGPSRIPPSGGNFAYVNISTPLGSSPVSPLQTDKTLTWTPNNNLGSPGNGGGGGGGNRVGPLFLQGSVPTSTSFPQAFTPGPVAPGPIIPYAVNISATPVQMASGGTGGSGSVWIIYPSDYAAATVTGNTPVPNPPAYRIYRWDGAGSITFN